MDDRVIGPIIDEAYEIYSLRPRGMYLLAAHIFVTSNAPQTGTDRTISSDDGGEGFSSIAAHRVGQQETRYFQTNTGRSSSLGADNLADYARTEYGRRFMRYFRQAPSVDIV